MSDYKDKSIFSWEAVRRGYDLGNSSAELFRDCMEAGHSFGMFSDLYKSKAKESERWDLVSPIGEVAGWIFSPIDTFFGIYHSIKNKTDKSQYI